MLRRLEHRSLFFRKKSDVSARTTWDKVDALFSSTALATHAAIDLGLVRKTPAGAFNSSRFYSANGKLEANYDKHHLLPGVEPEKPGDKQVLLNQPSGRWGLQICKDMDFPQLSRGYAAEGADLLLVPAWDFNLDRWLHARMAVLRAVENGFALARSARNGLLTLSDNRGRIIAEATTVPGRFVSVQWKNKRGAGENVLHANRRLVRLVVCRHVRRSGRIPDPCAMAGHTKRKLVAGSRSTMRRRLQE